MLENRICAVCGKEYTPHRASQITCSRVCRIERNRQLARLRQEAERPKEKKCHYCGKMFPYNGKIDYCSEACHKAMKKYRSVPNVPTQIAPPPRRRKIVCPDEHCSWLIKCGNNKGVCSRRSCIRLMAAKEEKHEGMDS